MRQKRAKNLKTKNLTLNQCSPVFTSLAKAQYKTIICKDVLLLSVALYLIVYCIVTFESILLIFRSRIKILLRLRPKTPAPGGIGNLVFLLFQFVDPNSFGSGSTILIYNMHSGKGERFGENREGKKGKRGNGRREKSGG